MLIIIENYYKVGCSINCQKPAQFDVFHVYCNVGLHVSDCRNFWNIRRCKSVNYHRPQRVDADMRLTEPKYTDQKCECCWLTQVTCFNWQGGLFVANWFACCLAPRQRPVLDILKWRLHSSQQFQMQMQISFNLFLMHSTNTYRTFILGFEVVIGQKIFWQNFGRFGPFPWGVTQGSSEGQSFKMFQMTFHVHQITCEVIRNTKI